MTTSLRFADLLSNTLHEIKLHSGKKISIVQDEIGYALRPEVTGDAIERWRYRKKPPAPEQLEQAARAILAYGAAEHDEAWLRTFLTAGEHPYIDAFVATLFAVEATVAIEAPPMAGYRAPETRGFIGRKAELTIHSAQLDRERYTILSGMAGVGKTSLAAQIAAQQSGMPVFWHTFREPTSDGLIRRLAGFLANLDSADLWQQLEASRSAGVNPPDNATCIDAILVGLTRINCLICLDDLHVAAGDQHVEKLTVRLLTLDGKQRPSLLITTRRIPRWLTRYEVEPLAGLTEADTVLLVSKRGGGFSAEQTAILHQHTGGHATFLNFALALLQRRGDPEKLLAQLGATDNVERYLLREVDDHLSEDERRIMQGIAIHAGQLATSEALQQITLVERVRSVVRNLLDQYLVLPIETVDENGYSLHGIVASFYTLQLSGNALKTLYGRAADFYLERNPLAAATYSEQANNVKQAASLLATHARSLAYEGKAVATLDILQRMPLDELEPALRVGVLMAIGVCGAAGGAFAAARQAWEQAAELLNELDVKPETTQQKVQVCQGMAELLERENVPEAIEWAQRGLAIVDRSATVEVAALETQLAIVQMHSGNFGAAMELLDGLDAVASDEAGANRLPRQLHIKVLYTLSPLYYFSNKYEQAIRVANRALSLCEQTNNHLLKLRVLNNMGPISYMKGDWQVAMDRLQEGLELALRLGDHDRILAMRLNLIGIYMDSGEDERAKQLLDEVIAQAASDGRDVPLMKGYMWQIRYLLFQLDAGAAAQLLKTTRAMARQQNDQHSLAILKGCAAEISLIEGKHDWASAEIEQAIVQIRALGDGATEAALWRTAGNIEAAKGVPEQAEKHYKRSIELLLNSDYDKALSQLDWADMLVNSAETTAAAQLLDQAMPIFESRGAQRELKRGRQLLAKLT